MAKVFVIGSGGREHAWFNHWSAALMLVRFTAFPGNGGIEEIAICPKLGLSFKDTNAFARFAKAENIDLTIVGPETPLVAGIADSFAAEGRLLFGPIGAAARIEGSKAFAKLFMRRHKIPTANFRIFENGKDATQYVLSRDCPLVVKADGSAGGKGVYVCHNSYQACTAIFQLVGQKIFGDLGNRIIIEEKIEGRECSFFVLSDGKSVVKLSTAVDYKRAFEGDTGPNTGGMGCYSPCSYENQEGLDERIMREIAIPTIEGLKEEGRLYKGCLYIGLMITRDGVPMVLEYNCRFGDPEMQVLVPRLQSDLFSLLYDTASGRLEDKVCLNSQAVGVVLTSSRYPEKETIRNRIEGPVREGQAGDGTYIFHGATVRKDNNFFAKGGRIMTVVARGSYQEARERVYKTIKKIHFDGMRFRQDIAAVKF